MKNEIRKEETQSRMYGELYGFTARRSPDALAVTFNKKSQDLDRLLESCNERGKYELDGQRGRLTHATYSVTHDLGEGEEHLPNITLEFEEFQQLGRPKKVCQIWQNIRTIKSVRE